MEVEEIQTQGSKFPRINNNNNNNNSRVGCNFPNLEGPNNEEDETKRASLVISSDFAPGRFCGWPASRIVRVSRASGGKDRHSKVWTSKGLRDRRVRLSVHTAIQFYDLQDRLGYDQPSKAVEWLLKAAASSIDELPSINTSFPLPDTPTGEVEIGSEMSQLQHSSNSETSKGSGGGGGGGGPLSGSRSENRVKARERAKERRAEREKERESVAPGHRQLLSHSSFTELLTGDGHRQWGPSNNNNNNNNNNGVQQMDYFSMGQYHSQIHPQQQQQLQQFSLLHDQMTVADLSFTMSSSSSSGNMNRGTLQSNSPHSLLLPHHHHYGSAVPFFIGTAAGPTTADHNHNNNNNNNNNQFPAGLHLCYGDGNGRHLDHKGKGKN